MLFGCSPGVARYLATLGWMITILSGFSKGDDLQKFQDGGCLGPMANNNAAFDGKTIFFARPADGRWFVGHLHFTYPNGQLEISIDYGAPDGTNGTLIVDQAFLDRLQPVDFVAV